MIRLLTVLFIFGCFTCNAADTKAKRIRVEDEMNFLDASEVETGLQELYYKNHSVWRLDTDGNWILKEYHTPYRVQQVSGTDLVPVTSYYFDPFWEWDGSTGFTLKEIT